MVGDSRTGETQKFDGPYYALRFIAASAARGMPVANIGRGATPFNVVPVDFIVAAMVELGRSEDAIGETLHLCDPAPLSSHEMFGLLAELYPARQASYRVPPALIAAALRIRPIRNLYGGTPPRIDPLPQPSGPLRHPPGERAARRFGAALSGLQRVRGGDGRLLPRARGRPGVRIP